MAIVFGHEIHIFIPSFGQNLDNMDDNKEKLTAKFAKMSKTFWSRMSSMHLLFVIPITEMKT